MDLRQKLANVIINNTSSGNYESVDGRLMVDEINVYYLTDVILRFIKQEIPQDKEDIESIIEYNLPKTKGIVSCDCGNGIYFHKHTNWIQCVVCNKIKVLPENIKK